MIGGKVLDASALAALVRGRLGVLAWLATARQLGIALYVPTLALTEVRTVLVDAGPQLAELLGHPSGSSVNWMRTPRPRLLRSSTMPGRSTPWPDTWFTQPGNGDGRS
ncbi:hypothetical protein [Pseudonocardia phyllosphaerae]|uniref:hypothetical protein n=1 Tax=Pseudonocardia phyllosphaerae TaxID=3390502 RepID=UPI0039781E74